MPSLVKLYDEFKNKGFVVLAIDIGEKKEVVKAFMKKANMPFPVPLDIDGSVARSYEVRAHPAHFLIDRDGKMIGKTIGGRNWESVETRNLIRSLVE